MKKSIFIIFALYNSFCFSQILKDTLNGKVKTIYDEIIFHNKEHNLPKLLTEEGDFGHSAMLFPNSIWKNAVQSWYYTKSIAYIKSKKTYNKDGFPTREIIYNLKGKILKDFSSNYDKNNNLIQFKENNNVRNYTYNSKNKLSTYLRYSIEEPNSYNYDLFVYNKKDSLVKIKEYTEEGLIFKTTYRYKNLSKKVFISSHLNMEFLEKECFFDKKDRIIKIVQYQGGFYESDTVKPKINYIIKKKYKKHLLIQITKSYTYDSIFSIEKFFYDKNDRIKKKQISTHNSKKSNWNIQFHYDNFNNITRTILTENKNVYIIDFKYVFDKQNNWVKLTKFINGKKLYSWKRKIKYF